MEKSRRGKTDVPEIRKQLSPQVHGLVHLDILDNNLDPRL